MFYLTVHINFGHHRIMWIDLHFIMFVWLTFIWKKCQHGFFSIINTVIARCFIQVHITV